MSIGHHESPSLPVERYTFQEWNRIQPEGIEVLDPDGFDRSPDSDDLTTRLYTRQEWLSRAIGGSTIIPHNGWDSISRLIDVGYLEGY
jgi:hypothetical protein